MGVPSFFISNRRAQKVAYNGFQYMKDRDTNTDTGVKYIGDMRTVNVNNFYFFCTNQFRPNFD